MNVSALRSSMRLSKPLRAMIVRDQQPLIWRASIAKNLPVDALLATTLLFEIHSRCAPVFSSPFPYVYKRSPRSGMKLLKRNVNCSKPIRSI